MLVSCLILGCQTCIFDALSAQQIYNKFMRKIFNNYIEKQKEISCVYLAKECLDLPELSLPLNDHL